MIANRWAAFLVAARLQISASLLGPFVIVLGVVQPTVFTALVLMAAGDRSTIDPARVVLGSGLIGLWGSTVWMAGQILRRERQEGTLPLLVTRPIDVQFLLLGKTVGGTLLSVTAIALSVTLTSALMGSPLRIASPGMFLLGLLITVTSATMLGLLLADVFVLTRAAPRVAEALLYPVFILGGLLFPVSTLPALLRPLSWFVSLRWGGEVLVNAASGVPIAPSSWGALIATTLAYGVLARVGYLRVLARVRETGTLELI